MKSLFLISGLLLAVNAQNSTSTSSGYPAQISPSWLTSITPLSGNVKSYPTGTLPSGSLPTINFNISAYPEAWVSPPTDSPEVQQVIAALDWSKIPYAPVRKADSNGDLSMSGYDESSDPDCWWSATGCVISKNPLVPPDAYQCPQVGYWGLTYDDGPLTSDAGEWAEPNLYDFLVAHNQTAGLFYIGSNVIAAPAAAQRGLADGHTICVHTWSHPAMTSKSNASVVAEFYWTMRAIKEVTGVTPKCWRPPYGDVDDRVRGIAWQMGLTTVVWDEDTNDWDMPGDGGGNLSPETVDGYFEGWINSYKNGTDSKTGHIVLEHELNNSTVSMAEKWLPTLQSTFKKVVPWNYCYNISQPYWETDFVYPTDENPNGANTVATAVPTTTTVASSTVAASSTTSTTSTTSAVSAAAVATTTSDKTSNASTTSDAIVIAPSLITLLFGFIAFLS